jgi:adenylylsulfate kinase
MSIKPGSAIWLTGLPSSVKSSITRELVKKIDAEGVPVIVLESDEMRKILTPEPAYTPGERDAFYRSMTLIGELITKRGVNVIFDATANKRAYRDYARSIIPRFMEVYITCPLEICMKRDPKGIYKRALANDTSTVPGIQSPYEPPQAPEATLDGRDPPEEAAVLLFAALKQLRYI